MPATSLPAGYRPTSLFWRVFALNALVFVVGLGALALSPATVSRPILPTELAILAAGLVLIITMNGILLRFGLAPLDRLMGLMATVDLLRPGQRIPERGSRDMAPLARAFNDMLGRLERERAASSTHALSAQEAERRRVARELHDEIGQSLTVLLLELSRLADQVPATTRPMVEQAVETARDSLTDVRRIARRLRPDVLDDLGLVPALTALLDEFAEFSGVQVRRRLLDTPALSDDAEVVVYRIAQESLTNVARHAGARSVDVALVPTEDGGVGLVVADDGGGFSGDEGAGIRGMRERALLVHADLSIATEQESGTTVSLTLPASAARSEEEEAADGAGSRPAR